MKNVFKRLLTFYLGSWWVPALVFFVLTGAFTGVAVPRWWVTEILVLILLPAAGLALLGVLVAAIWNFAARRWGKGIVNLFLFGLGVGVMALAFGFFCFVTLFGPSEDGFADGLKIPDDVSAAGPSADLAPLPGGKEDAFQAALLAALLAPGGEDPTVTAEVSSLTRLQLHPEILRRYLAANPAWCRFREHGADFATRRWRIGPEWRYRLYGYYGADDIGMGQRFLSRFTLGLSGEAWGMAGRTPTWLKPGERARATLSLGNQMQESLCLVSTEGLVVEVLEQSQTPERRLTTAALRVVNAELKPLADSPTWETARALLPPDSIRVGASSLELRHSFQPGLYDFVIWVNPGEPGLLYLRAFELTHGTALSQGRLWETTNEYVGWSENPQEVFFSNRPFTIYEGDWGKPYAARFEVWFTPAASGQDRKLIEKVFKIEGWQR